MSIFDKGFDPLQEIQRATKTAGEAAAMIAEGASGMAVAAGAAIADATTATGEAASKLAEGATGAATAAGAAIAGAADGVKAALDEKEAERLDAEKAEYAPKVQEALRAIEATRAQELLGSFQESPLPLTEANAAKVKSAFPIPREQTVVWADAEFDLRPSGIAMTEKGVYIKADADAFAVPGKEKRQARLFYFEWAYFEPGPFASDGESNLALTVDEACRGQFVSRCQAIRDLEDDHAAGIDSELATVDDTAVKAAAVAAAATINSNGEVFVEQRAAVNNPAGHGELAEEANSIIDRLQGHQAEILGRDNAKNGPDRSVDGVLIQTKYYKTARGSLEACFDPSSHKYRYLAKDGTPMQLEVPKDQYQQVLRGFEKKISQGKVPGVSDPRDAEKIVRKGKLTYDQALNLAKPGTAESLKYDAATGAVTCSCAFGLSFLATTFMAYRETRDITGAVQAGIAAGVQVFGLSFAQHMVVSQLSRTGLSNALMAPSQAVVGELGFKASATIVNGLRALTGKTAISGAAHGGDEKHIPINRKKLAMSGFDYVAMGHIHKPEIDEKMKMAYSGSLEPIDMNDIGPRGYIYGEISKRGLELEFVPFAKRIYRELDFTVTPTATNLEIRHRLIDMIKEQGQDDMYKITFSGYRDPDFDIDVSDIEGVGNVVSVTDNTVPDYDFEELYAENKDNILGMYIKKFLDMEGLTPLQRKTLYYGTKALMDAMEDRA